MIKFLKEIFIGEPKKFCEKRDLNGNIYYSESIPFFDISIKTSDCSIS